MQRTCQIVNTRGLHARAAAKFVRLAETFQADITMAKDGIVAAGTSILGLMMLAAGKGSAVVLEARGSDEAQALDALCELIASGFGEPGDSLETG